MSSPMTIQSDSGRANSLTDWTREFSRGCNCDGILVSFFSCQAEALTLLRFIFTAFLCHSDDCSETFWVSQQSFALSLRHYHQTSPDGAASGCPVFHHMLFQSQFWNFPRGLQHRCHQRVAASAAFIFDWNSACFSGRSSFRRLCLDLCSFCVYVCFVRKINYIADRTSLWSGQHSWDDFVVLVIRTSFLSPHSNVQWHSRSYASGVI